MRNRWQPGSELACGTGSGTLPANEARALGGLCLGLTIGLLTAVNAAEPAVHAERTLAIGVIAHDRGFASDNHENGIDLNLEMLFAPLDLAGSPRPHVGATLNFAGDTSIAYGGLSFTAFEAAPWFADLLLGAAIHNGPLHKDPVRCDVYSDCGYGIRVVPRFGFEVGCQLNHETTISLYYDHMSHKWIIGGENEGLEHIGVRYLRPY